MANLIERIMVSPYSAYLFPVSSMFSLLIFSADEWEYKIDMLMVDFVPDEGKFRFEFFENPYLSPRWEKECPTEEGYSAFIHFLKLKQWFSVVEVPRGG